MPRNTRWLFYLSLAVLTFVVGAWLVRTPEPARPLPWLADWQEQVLAPLADNALTLRQLQGEAWVYPQLGLTAHLPDDDLRLMLAVPRQALEKPPR